MDKNVFKEIILAQQERIANVELIERSYDIEDGLNYVFVGLRRAGKTYLLYQYIQSLLAKGINKEEILFINFEDERINDISKEELHLIIDAYREMYEYEPIIFFDVSAKDKKRHCKYFVVCFVDKFFCIPLQS